MRWSIVVCAALVLLSFRATYGQSPDINSGNFMLPYCRDALDASKPGERSTLIIRGQCWGIVQTAYYVGPMLNAADRYCPPEGATIGQALNIVVRYLDAHPEMLQKDFKLLSMTALFQAWPCK